MNTPTDTGITFTGAFTCTHHTDSERIACPVCLVTALRDELAVAQNWVEHHSKHAEDLIAENVELRAELHQLRDDCDNETKWAAHYLAQSIADKARADKADAELAAERARLERITTALTDAISTYFGADKLVTAERIEAWQAALKEDAK